MVIILSGTGNEPGDTRVKGSYLEPDSPASINRSPSIGIKTFQFQIGRTTWTAWRASTACCNIIRTWCRPSTSRCSSTSWTMSRTWDHRFEVFIRHLHLREIDRSSLIPGANQCIGQAFSAKACLMVAGNITTSVNKGRRARPLIRCLWISVTFHLNHPLWLHPHCPRRRGRSRSSCRWRCSRSQNCHPKTRRKYYSIRWAL